MTKSKILFLLILFIGVFLRLYGNNWDQGWHLHPDERFLTMVGNDVKIPSSFSEYLNTPTSSFNPGNKGHAFYVYGTLPLLINKVLAQQVYSDTYDQFNLLGRVLSGLADFFVIIILYKLIELVEKKLKLNTSIKYLSSFLYAIAVLPIQLSHFFTVDTFLNLFVWASFYFAVKLVVYTGNTSYSHSGEKRSDDSRIDSGQARMTQIYYVCLSGLFFGLALACKISALYFAPLIGIFVFFGLAQNITAFSMSLLKLKIIDWIPAFAGMTIFFLFCYLAVRIGSPYYFETNTILNPQLSAVFINNIQTLKSFDNPAALFPPANQWIHASPFLSITNLIFFGVGPVYFLFAVIGFLLLLNHRKPKLLLFVLFWVMGFTFYQSIQFAKTMRYLIFIYPFLSIFAAVGLSYVLNLFKKLSTFSSYMLHATCYICILVWPLAFMSIYTMDHSRVTASKWMYRTIPQGSTILTEYWDDPLPLMVQDPRTRNYIGREVHIFDPDTKEKWQVINEQLNTADYYIMSSNRGWGSVPTTPERYPVASQFYKKMLEKKGNYTLIQEFSSYPSLRYLGIPLDFPDQWAEEAFTVYDHPQVLIFKKNKTQ